MNNATSAMQVLLFYLASSIFCKMGCNDRDQERLFYLDVLFYVVS